MPVKQRRTQAKATKSKPPIPGANDGANDGASSELSPQPPAWTRWFTRFIGFAFLIYGIYQYTQLPPLVSLTSPHGATEESDMYTVVKLPGKGMGLVASRDIAPGEVVIREEPLFLVPPEIQTSPAELIFRLLNNANPSGREAFLNLSYVRFPKGLDPTEHPDQVALAIFQTNAVAAGDHVGVFPRMARLNHGCASAFNAVYSWRNNEGALYVHALKRISKGEEILTTYFDTKKSREQRRQHLSDQYGFWCTCAVCSLPDVESRASDQRLTEIAELYARFATWGRGELSGPEAIETVRRIWKIEEMEGYWSERGQLAADAAWVAASHSDAKAAREWIALALEWFSRELGSEREEVQKLRGTLEDGVTSHPVWGTRERLEVGGPAHVDS